MEPGLPMKGKHRIGWGSKWTNLESQFLWCRRERSHNSLNCKGVLQHEQHQQGLHILGTDILIRKKCIYNANVTMRLSDACEIPPANANSKVLCLFHNRQKAIERLVDAAIRVLLGKCLGSSSEYRNLFNSRIHRGLESLRCFRLTRFTQSK